MAPSTFLVILRQHELQRICVIYRLKPRIAWIDEKFKAKTGNYGQLIWQKSLPKNALDHNLTADILCFCYF